MSFGWFVCIYLIGWAVSALVAAAAACMYLSRKCPVIWEWLVRAVMASDACSTSLVGATLSGVCSVLLWPVVIPRNAIQLVHKCNKKYRELYL